MDAAQQTVIVGLSSLGFAIWAAVSSLIDARREVQHLPRASESGKLSHDDKAYARRLYLLEPMIFAVIGAVVGWFLGLLLASKFCADEPVC